MKSLFPFCFLFITALLSAQNIRIETQNFHGVKTVTFFTTQKDSLGRISVERMISGKILFDTAGRKIRQECYDDKGRMIWLFLYAYDSLGRLSMKTDSLFREHAFQSYRYVYSTDTIHHFIFCHIYKSKSKEVDRTIRTATDTLDGRKEVSYWEGEKTYGAPETDEYLNGQLVLHETRNGYFDEFFYDSLGTVSGKRTRGFIDGECAYGNSERYINKYENGRLVSVARNFFSYSYEYNDKGFISVERELYLSESYLIILEAEYTYY